MLKKLFLTIYYCWRATKEERRVFYRQVSEFIGIM